MHTYNFTLRRLVLPHVVEHEQQLVIDSVVESIGRVRQDYQRLQHEWAPHVGQHKVLPEAMARINRFPTLLHRLLREPGNAAILSSLMEQEGRRRRHRPPHEGRSAGLGKRPRSKPQPFDELSRYA